MVSRLWKFHCKVQLSAALLNTLPTRWLSINIRFYIWKQSNNALLIIYVHEWKCIFYKIYIQFRIAQLLTNRMVLYYVCLVEEAHSFHINDFNYQSFTDLKVNLYTTLLDKHYIIFQQKIVNTVIFLEKRI